MTQGGGDKVALKDSAVDVVYKVCDGFFSVHLSNHAISSKSISFSVNGKVGRILSITCSLNDEVHVFILNEAELVSVHQTSSTSSRFILTLNDHVS